MRIGRALEQIASVTVDRLIDHFAEVVGEEVVDRNAYYTETDPPQPFAGLSVPILSVDVSYTDDVEGGNRFFMPIEAARMFVLMMLGEGAEEYLGTGDDLNELELSAIGEQMNQIMAEAAADAGDLAGVDVGILPPEKHVIRTIGELNALNADKGSTHITMTRVSLFGMECRLVQWVPHAFVLQMARAEGVEIVELPEQVGGNDLLSAAVQESSVRVWAEIGRVRVPIGVASTLPSGAILELAERVDDPAIVYANGVAVGKGRLMTTPDGMWAVELDEVSDLVHSPSQVY